MSDKSYKVLIVDDDQFLLNMYSTKFTNSGHEPITATSTEAALDKLRGDVKPDAVLLDIIMPTMDGVECLDVIRKENLVSENVAIIMLTNQKNDDNIKKIKELGVDGYIVKAAAIPSEVIEQVVEIIDGKLANQQ